MQPPAEIGPAGVEERIEALGTLVGEIADRVRATELVRGDEKAAKELRRAMEAVAKHDPKLESRLTNRIDVLSDRLGTLASAVSTTSSELARRDGEIAALRRELDRGSAHIQTLGEELARGAPAAEIEKLRKLVATLATEHPPRKGDEQVVRLGGKVDYLTERVDTLAKTVAATAAGLAGRDGDLAALRQKLDERTSHFERALEEQAQGPVDTGLGSRLDALEAELEQAVAGLAQLIAATAELRQVTAQTLEAHAASQNSKVSGLAARIDVTTADIEAKLAGMAEKYVAVEHRIAEHDVVLSSSARESGQIAELERHLAELAGRQESAEHDRSAVVARLDAVANERDNVAAEFGRVSRVVADQLAELAERIEHVERLGAEGASETARVSAELASRVETITSLEAQLQAISARMAQAGERTASEGSRFAELDERLQAAERTGVATAAEIARVASSWAAELDRIAAKIDDSAVTAQDATARDAQAELLTELNTRLDAIVHERQAVAAQIARASENEVAELRSLIDGLRARFSPPELEQPGSLYVGGRFDELTRRLDSIDDSVSEPGFETRPGEGRLRLELRALELRAERAEKEARQNRDAVLAQLDVLAGQIDSRFQRLESDAAESSHAEEPAHAEVVPLRGAEV